MTRLARASRRAPHLQPREVDLGAADPEGLGHRHLHQQRDGCAEGGQVLQVVEHVVKHVQVGAPAQGEGLRTHISLPLQSVQARTQFQAAFGFMGPHQAVGPRAFTLGCMAMRSNWTRILRIVVIRRRKRADHLSGQPVGMCCHSTVQRCDVMLM